MQFRVFIKGTSLSVYLKHLPGFLERLPENKNQAKNSKAGFSFGKLYPAWKRLKVKAAWPRGIISIRIYLLPVEYLKIIL